MSNAVEVHQLTKRYGKVTALNELSIALNEGRIYGLLGRNGAGKTTLLQLITARIFATSGDIRVFGAAPYENAHVLSQICFVREDQKYPESFRVVETVDSEKLARRLNERLSRVGQRDQ